MNTSVIDTLNAEIEQLKARLAAAEDALHRRSTAALARPVDPGSAPAALADSRERYQRLLDTIDEGFCIIQMKFDAQGAACDYKFIETNRAFEKHTGLVDVCGHWIRDLVPEHDQHWFDLYGDVARTGHSVRYENRAGALGRWFEVHATAVDADGDLVAVLFNDTTAQRNAEQALRASEAYWRGVFEKLNDGFILGEVIRDATGAVVDWKYLDVNNAWSLKVGVPAIAAQGHTVRELFPEIEEFWITEAARAVASQRSAAFKHPVGRLGRWYEGRVHPLSEDRFTIIFQDITEQHGSALHRQALLEFGDQVRDLQDPQAMAQVAIAVVARTLTAMGACYVELEHPRQVIT